MHCRQWILFGFVRRNWEDIARWVNLILETFTKVQKCIEEDVFSVPELCLLNIFHLLKGWKHVYGVKINDQFSAITAWFQILRKPVKVEVK